MATYAATKCFRCKVASILKRINYIPTYVHKTWATRDRYYDFLIFSPKNGVLAQNKAVLCKNVILTLVFDKNCSCIFRRKLSKIAESCDLNIDARKMAEISFIIFAAKFAIFFGFSGNFEEIEKKTSPSNSEPSWKIMPLKMDSM
jgi:hypothetical protein